MKANSFTRNSIQLPAPDGAIKQLLIWLAEHTQELGILICCVESAYEIGEKGDKVFGLLKEEVIKALSLEGDSTIDQKNLDSLVFYMHNGVARGLSITFGCHEAQDPTIVAECKKEVYAFIAALPKSKPWRSDIFLLSLLRMCLSIYGLNLGFSNDSLLYRWPENNDKFRVQLSQAPDTKNEIHLQVIKPLKNSRKSSNWYKRYYSPPNPNNPGKTREKVEKELTTQLRTRLVNEVFWNALLESLLTEANIPFQRLQFTPTLDVRMPKEQHDEFILSMQPMGADLSNLAKKYQRKKGFALCYAFMATEDTSETELEELRKAITKAVATLNEKDSAAQLYLKEVPFKTNLTGIDVVIDIKENEEDTGADSWKSSHEKTRLDYYGQYRKKTIKAGNIATKQLISSYLLTGSNADNVLYRCITDALLKKWLISPSALRQVQAKLPPLESQQFIVMSTKNWRQIHSNNTPATYNFFTAFYKISLLCDASVDNTMLIQAPQISAQWGVSKSSKEKTTLFSYLEKAARSQHHAQTLHQLLTTISLNTTVISRISDKFLNHDTTYLFEVKNNALVCIWEILPDHQASLIPDIHDNYNVKEDDFRQFISQCLQDGLFSRDEKYSRIIENKRLVADAEYDIQYAGNEVLIARKMFSEKQHTKRVLLQRMRRIYHLAPSSELQEHDLQPILAGLIGDAGAQSSRSGAKQSFYEKLIKLMISD